MTTPPFTQVPTQTADPAPPRRFVSCSLARLDPALVDAVIAIGNFDGVHLGHRAVLDTAQRLAGTQDTKAVAMTFEPHPRTFFRPDAPVFRLTPPEAKARIFSQLGLDGMIVAPFDASFAGLSAEAFMDDLLAGQLHVRGIVVGPDFHFGKGRAGSPERLAQWAAARGIAIEIVPVLTEGSDVISSSAIRAALEAGDIARANALLGYCWFVSGEVRHGDKRGRELGYPTANLRLPDDCRLRHGIYAVRVATPQGVFGGVASFGRRPTFDNGAPLLEPYLFGFSGDLYGQTIEVEFIGWIRGEEKFNSAEALIARMDADSDAARRMLAAPDDVLSMIS